MSAPRESNFWACYECHELHHHSAESYSCQAHAGRHDDCYADQVCVGCIYQCADCDGDFCRSHIVETPLPSFHAERRCVPCQVIHTALRETHAALPTLDLMPLAA